MSDLPPAGPVMSNPRADRVRNVAKLATRSGRNRRSAFVAEGPQAVREALSLHRRRVAAGGPPVVEELYATEDCLQRHPELGELAPGALLRLATDDVLAAMGDTVTPQGILAVCAVPTASLSEVLATRPRLVAVMCRVQDPGNAGTVLRAADAAGADAVVLTEGSVDIFNPKAVRSTVGSIFHLPIVTGVGFADAAASLADAGIQTLAADGYAELDLDELQDASAARRLAAPARDDPGEGTSAAEAAADAGRGSRGTNARGPGPAGQDRTPRLEDATAWLFGNEAQGLSADELDAADHRVAVPLYGVAESLNVGTAATVCLYASARAQRRLGEVPAP